MYKPALVLLLLCTLMVTPGAMAADMAGNSAPDSLDEALTKPGVATSIMLGRALLESGDAAGALGYYLNAWDADPSSRETGLRVAEVAVLARQPEVAIDVLGSLHAADPGDVEVGARLSLLHFALGDPERAVLVADTLSARYPDDPSVMELRLDLSEMQGDYEEALGHLDRLLSSEGADTDLLTRRGVLLLALARSDEAEIEFRAALELDPGSEDASSRLTDLLVNQGRQEELMAELHRRVDEGLATPRQTATLADLYLSTGQLDEAAQILLPMASAGDLDGPGELLLVQLLGDLDRQEEAIALLDDMQAQDPERVGIESLRGALLHDLQRYDEAEASLRAALAVDPDDNDARVTLLLTLTARDPAVFGLGGDPDPDFEAVLDEAAQRAELRSLRQQFLIGAMYRRIGRADPAIAYLKRAAALPGASDQVLYELAVAQQEAGRGIAAAGTLEQLLKRVPDSPEYLNFYGYLLAEQGRELERAESMIRQALAADPDNGAYIDSLGWVYYQRGDLERALEELIRAVNIVGDDPVVLEHLGDCLRDLGQIQEARRTYERARAAGADAERIQSRLEGLEGLPEGGSR